MKVLELPSVEETIKYHKERMEHLIFTKKFLLDHLSQTGREIMNIVDIQLNNEENQIKALTERNKR